MGSGSRLDGRVAVITGAAQGQGEAAARLFVTEGASVALADIRDDEGRALAAELGSRARYVHLDVCNEDQWVAAVATVEEQFGRLAVLLNNAGILRFGSAEATSLEDYLEVLRVNQVGVFLGMRTVIGPMTRAGGGSIINVSSVEGLRGMPDLMGYGASKWAVRGMTKVAAVELGPRGIRVNSIHPGVIDTPMVRSLGLEGADLDAVFRAIPLARAGRPAEVAYLALFLASDESSYCTGAEFVVDGGATAFIGWGGALPTV